MTDEAPRWFRDLVDREDEIIPLLPAGTSPPRLRPKPPPKSGILVVDKPAGLTSHDVVQRIRRAAEERRVGHAGTLDPTATGVLVVCLGSATRVIEAIQDGSKKYVAAVHFGVETTTYDTEGETVARVDAAGITAAAVESALESYRGHIDQVPPMYSALKHQGRPLYELAREGEEVTREPRRVTVEAMRLVDWSPPVARLEMTVSKGFYVRSLAHDLGHALGVGAHLAELRRTAVGRFDLDVAVTLEDAVQAFQEGWWPRLLFALDYALVDLSAMVVGEEAEEHMRHGRQFDGPRPSSDATESVRVYGGEGIFVGLARFDEISGCWQPERVFPRPEDN